MWDPTENPVPEEIVLRLAMATGLSTSSIQQAARQLLTWMQAKEAGRRAATLLVTRPTTRAKEEQMGSILEQLEILVEMTPLVPGMPSPTLRTTLSPIPKQELDLLMETARIALTREAVEKMRSLMPAGHRLTVERVTMHLKVEPSSAPTR